MQNDLKEQVCAPPDGAGMEWKNETKLLVDCTAYDDRYACRTGCVCADPGPGNAIPGCGPQPALVGRR